MIALDDMVLFPADDGAHGIELWRSDGTLSGTVLVKDICLATKGGVGVTPTPVLANNVLFFFASDGTPAWRLWKTDGTVAGTGLIKDFSADGYAYILWMQGAGNNVFVLVYRSYTMDLWRSDGTAAGTELLRQFVQTSGDRFITGYRDAKPAAAGSRLVFMADDGVAGFEPWVSDGTVRGTALLRDIWPGAGSSFWNSQNEFIYPWPMVSFGSEVYFGAFDYTWGEDSFVSGIWKTDGTPHGTRVVKEAVRNVGPFDPEEFMAVGNTVFFRARDEYGTELWKTDGTEAGTMMVKDINPQWNSSYPMQLTTAGGLLFFKVYSDGVHQDALWRSDGTPEGTYLVSDMKVGVMGAAGNMLVFLGYNAPYPYPDVALWGTDGTPGGVWKIKDGWSGPKTTIGNLAYFYADDGIHGAEPWVSDGTPGGTYMIADINPGSVNSSPMFFAPLNGRIFCVASADSTGSEWWVIDVPSPKITQLNPSSVAANWSSDIELTVSGEFFESGAVVNWNGIPCETTYGGASQLTAILFAEDLTSTEDIRMATVTVQNPDGRISNPEVFSILGTVVDSFASGLAPAGQPVAVSVPSTSTEPGISARILNPDGSAVSVTVARYDSNPTSGLVFDVSGGFVDLQVIGADDRDQVTATFCYPLGVTGDVEAALRLLYFDGNNWVEVRSSGNTDPIKDTLDSPVAGGRFMVVFDATSTPPVTQLSGTVFTFSAPILTLVQTPAAPVQIGAEVPISVGVTPVGLQSLTLTLDWGDGTSAEVVSVTGPQQITRPHAYSTPGVYTVTINASDGSVAVANLVLKYVVVYDPAGGFVTGGGWINSPLGAYTLDPNLTGKATFGFVAKYLKGANVPSGNTEFQFKAGDLNFKSTSYQWLVVAGPRAQFKGVGTINGEGNYGFILTAIDGQLANGGGMDRFRIKIRDVASDTPVYDNQAGWGDTAVLNDATILRGGSIVIYKP